MGPVATRARDLLDHLDTSAATPSQLNGIQRLRAMIEKGIEPAAPDLKDLAELSGVGVEMILLGRRLRQVPDRRPE